MCPQAPTAVPTAEPSPGRVVRCERIAAGPRAALIRVTLALEAIAPSSVVGAQLVAHDMGTTVRCPALPAPAGARGSHVTLGFALTRTATPLALMLGERVIAIAETDEVKREIERELDETRARLKESRGTCAMLQAARREALRAAAQAEVAAHDAHQRAELLARELAQAGRARGRLHLPARLRTRRGVRRDGLPAPTRHGDAPGRTGTGGRGTRLAVVACALGTVAVGVAILAWPAGKGDRHGVGGVPEAAASAASPPGAATARVEALARRLRIPVRYLTLYREAAARYGLDWTRLAAIGAIESAHGQSRFAGVLTGANPDGASGPAQFLPGTWERFGLDGNGDGLRDPHEAADAIHAMASYLRASGAPQDWRSALRSYNHSDAYVDAVERLAASLRSHAS